MPIRSKVCSVGLLAVILAFTTGTARASDNPAMDQDVLQIANDWARIRYQVTGPAEQRREIEALAVQARDISARYPGQVEPLLWQGIVTSEEAAMANVLHQLGFAIAARNIFEQAQAIDPHGANGSVIMSLGVLYYRVPGFPIAFGNDKMARQDLECALAMQPDGLDANYFYGDFLVQQGEYAKARAVLSHALQAPVDAQRPVWDAGRRAEVRSLIAKIDQRAAS
jgi:tetratricopeptide (TPR) repeat protein